MSDALELSETDPTVARLHIGTYRTEWMRRDDATEIHQRICELSNLVVERDRMIRDISRAVNYAHSVVLRVDHEDGR